jgi:glycosyltransferase involved in cell wall biosynthesis
VTAVPDAPAILTMAAGMGLDPFAMSSGPAVHLRDLHRAFAGAGYRSEILCAGPKHRRLEDPAGFLLRGVGPPFGSILLAPFPDLQERMYSRRFLAEGLRTAHRISPAFIYERDALFNTGGLALARQLGLPHLLEVNAPLRLERRHFRRFRFERLAERCEADLIRGTDGLIAVSGAMRDYLLERGAPKDKVHVVPNGADTDRFPAPLDTEQALDALGLPRDRVLVGHVGTLKPWHGTADLARCLFSALERRPELGALVVGDGPGLPLLRRETGSAGLADRVRFTGAVDADRVPGLLAACRIVLALYPPAGENEFYFSPLKVLEAMAAGLPVVATRQGQIGDLVRDGVDGILVGPGDWQAAARALLDLAADPERSSAMGRSAMERCRERFSWSAVARRIIGLAREVGADV